MNKNQFFKVIVSYGIFLYSIFTTFAQTTTKNYTTVYNTPRNSDHWLS